MSKRNTFDTIENSTIYADSTAMGKRQSRAIETELGIYDYPIIQDCVNKGISSQEAFQLCNQNRTSSGRPLITQPAVSAYYDKCEKSAAKANCVFTGVQTKNFVEIHLGVGSVDKEIGVIRIPVCEPMAKEISQHGIHAKTMVGITSSLGSTEKVTEGDILPVLPGSSWTKSRAK